MFRITTKTEKKVFICIYDTKQQYVMPPYAHMCWCCRFLFQNCVNGVYPLILTVNLASFFAYILPINLSHKSSKKVKQKNKFRHAIKKSKVYLYSTAVFSTKEMKKSFIFFFAKHKKKYFYLTC